MSNSVSAKIHILIRIAAAVLAVIWMVRIFSFSSDDAEVSGTVSRSMSYNMIEKISRHLHLGWDEEQIEAVAGPVEKYLRKAAHMYEYAVLSVLLGTAADAWRYVRTRRRDKGRPGLRPFIRTLAVIAVCLIYAVSDEFHQVFVDGRSGEIRDVCLDAGGAVIGLALGALAVYLFRRHISKRDNEGQVSR